MIDLLFVPTANGQKATILLEEAGLEYTATRVEHGVGGPPPATLLAKNPIGRYPVLTESDGPGGGEIIVFESHAIALYLADRTGLLLPDDPIERSAAHVWAAVASTDLTPTMATQFFLTLRAETDVSEAITWIEAEAQRYLRAINQRLSEATYLAGNTFSLADLLTYPLMATSVQRLGGFTSYKNIVRWFDLVSNRPAVQRGMARAG